LDHEAANPPEHGLEPVEWDFDRRIFGAVVHGDRLYLAGSGEDPELRILELAESPDGPTPVTEIRVPLEEPAAALQAQGEELFLLAASGLQVMDLSDPLSPVLAGRVEWEIPPGSWTSLVVSGPLAVVSHSRGAPGNRNVTVGISLIDIGDASDPREVGSLDLPEGSDNVGDLEISGSLVLVAARQSGLYLFDVADPAAPRLLGNYTPRSWSRGVVVKGDVVYLSVSMTRNASSIHVLDISDPSRPALIREMETPGPAQQMAITDDRLYVADHQAGLRVYDLAEPTDPIFLGQNPTYLGQFPTEPGQPSTDLIATEIAAGDGLVVVWGHGGMRLLRRVR